MPFPAGPPSGSLALRILGGRNLLFSEVRQAIYDVDDLAAYCWRSLEEGLSPGEMVRELVGAGADLKHAQSAVRTSLHKVAQTWCTGQARSAAARCEPPGPAASNLLKPKSTGRLETRTLEIAGVIIRLHLSSGLLDIVDEVFGHLRSENPAAQVELFARMRGDRVRFSPGPAGERPCRRIEFAPLLKAQLIDKVLRSAQYEVALHAAGLVRDDRVLLLVGRPGAGKTTLSLALTSSGFAMDADDVVLLHDGGLVTGLQFPAASKAGAWKLVARRWPHLLSSPIYRRPDRKQVRYLFPNRIAPPTARKIGWIVFLNRRPKATSSVVDVDPLAALRGLIGAGAARDRRLSTAAFTSLVSTLQDVRCCQLTYSDLDEATGRLLDLCS